MASTISRHYIIGRALIIKPIADVVCVLGRLNDCLLCSLVVPFISYNLNDEKELLAPSEGFREFNFINPSHITTKFDAVVILGEGFEINMFEYVSLLPMSTTCPLPHVVSSHRNSGDEMTK